jgi:hypothetical protein
MGGDAQDLGRIDPGKIVELKWRLPEPPATTCRLTVELVNGDGEPLEGQHPRVRYWNPTSDPRPAWRELIRLPDIGNGQQCRVRVRLGRLMSGAKETWEDAPLAASSIEDGKKGVRRAKWDTEGFEGKISYGPPERKVHLPIPSPLGAPFGELYGISHGGRR